MDSSSHHHFVRHLARNFIMGIFMTIISLSIGMLGYHYFEKMNWLDAYMNAAMILSGMGPLYTPYTYMGKLFAGTYALFSGIIFLVIIAVIFLPIFHRFFKKIHLESRKGGN